MHKLLIFKLKKPLGPHLLSYIETRIIDNIHRCTNLNKMNLQGKLNIYKVTCDKVLI